MLITFRAIILCNSSIMGLKAPDAVDAIREKIFTALEEYSRLRSPDDGGRFAKLLLRLPTLRSIGLKCMDQSFFFRLQLTDGPIDDYLTDLLESPSDM